MHRFHIPPAECRGAMATLTDREAHHALHVLRVQRGERVIVLDGAGTEIHCEVQGADRKAVTLSVVEKKLVRPLPCQITLLQAIPKGKIIEDIIEKATELGVHRIVPILSERVTTRLNAASAAEKQQKWQLVAVEAIKQCGAAWLPQVESPLTPKQFLERMGAFDLALVGSLQSDARHPRHVFREFQSRQNRQPRSVCVWVGPEGDFTLEELRMIQSSGARPISLGRLVLRVETAAIFCLSILNYEFQAEESAVDTLRGAS